MSISYLIEHLVHTEILIQIKDLLNNLCSLDLDLLEADGTPVQLSNNQNKISAQLDKMLPPAVKCKNNNCGKASCFSKKSHVFQKIFETKESEVFICEQGYRKILVPIVVKDEILAFLFSGENSAFRLNGIQIQSIINLLQKVIDQIINKELKYFSEFQGAPLTHQQKLLKKAMEYIHENYYLQDLSLQDMAQKLGFSYHYLSRIFNRELNTTFVQYRNRVRLDVASKLLKDWSLTISQVSYSCGFEDPGYFCKVFKNSFGVAPMDYRKKNTHNKRKRKVKISRLKEDLLENILL